MDENEIKKLIKEAVASGVKADNHVTNADIAEREFGLLVAAIKGVLYESFKRVCYKDKTNTPGWAMAIVPYVLVQIADEHFETVKKTVEKSPLYDPVWSGVGNQYRDLVAKYWEEY